MSGASARLDTSVDAFLTDPYPSYAVMREHHPVVHDEELDVWMVFRHDDCAELLKHPAMTVAFSRGMRLRPEQQPERMARMHDAMAGRPFPRPSHSVYQSDPPEHTRRRRALGGAIAGRTAGLATHIGALVDRQLAVLEDRGGTGGADLMRDYAFPLHTSVIDWLVGFRDDADHQTLVRRWSHLAVKMADPESTAEVLHDGFEATADLERHCAALIEEKRAAGPVSTNGDEGPDVVSALLAMQQHDEPSLTDDEILDQVVLVYLAGLESTANLIGNGLHALFEHPAELERWRWDRGLDASGVDELLRFDSPVQFTRRMPLQSMDVRGHTIPEGAFVLTWLGAGNRDPERFGVDADVLRLDRGSASALQSFGGGIHLCLGAPLSRLEGRLAIPALLRRFPALHRLGPTVWNERVMLRGVDCLPIGW